eukprot:10963371-Karenia_brevis.AAC.1
MKNNKASGPDSVDIELIKMLDSESCILLTDFLNELWKEELPNSLMLARIASIYKKGSPKDLGNYRPISILN